VSREKKLRISAVSFLNARPITYGLEQMERGAWTNLGSAERSPSPGGAGTLSGSPSQFELSFDLPARCAERLATGDADLGLIPVGAYATSREELRIVPGIAIAGHGAVRTVLLVGEVPWEQMREIALDGASRSSAMLVRLLCHERGLTPAFREVPHDEVLDAARGTTGALVIGDAGFDAEARFPHVQDLGAAWHELTGLPFVYAVWAGRPDAVDADAIARLQRSLDDGLAARPIIARAHAEAHGGDPAVYESYLSHNIRYRLGAAELSGLAAFFSRARAAGLIDGTPRARLYEAGRAGATPVSNIARSRSVDTLLADAAAGGRLSPEEAMRVYAEAPVLELGAAADARRRMLHPDDVVTYIIDRNVNYTNVCVTRCKFCNFYRPPTNKTEGYVLSRDELARKFQETVDLGGVQILLQGGLNPNLPLTWYEDLFRWMKANFPLAIHGLSPEEVRYIAELENLPIRAVVERLIAAGLDSIPGGGAEILDDEIRHAISPLKCTADTWMEVMRQAHALGLRTTATMVFGFGEESRHIIGHLEKLRSQQDLTAGFTAFICWPFQAEGTRLKLHDDTTAMRYLRIFALSRLYLDNFPGLQVSWPTMGPEVGQVGLRFGGNDFGSAMIEENVVSQAGAVFKLSAADIERYIRSAGFQPRRRNMRYERLAAA
jgi:cyclic dehypoxanthinyl futalosine synthase